jgi:hypothetical protein
MSRRGAFAALTPMAHDEEPMPLVTERFERRLGEECGRLRLDMTEQFGKVRADMATEIGKLRTEMGTENARLRTDMATENGKLRAEMATEFGKVRTEMAEGFGSLRAEMIGRNADLLKWLLVFFVTQIAAIAALLRLFR